MNLNLSSLILFILYLELEVMPKFLHLDFPMNLIVKLHVLRVLIKITLLINKYQSILCVSIDNTRYTIHQNNRTILPMQLIFLLSCTAYTCMYAVQPYKVEQTIFIECICILKPTTQIHLLCYFTDTLTLLVSALHKLCKDSVQLLRRPTIIPYRLRYVLEHIIYQTHYAQCA